MRANLLSQSSLVRSLVPGVDPVVSPADPLMGDWWADRSRGDFNRESTLATAGAIKRYARNPPHHKVELGRWLLTPEGQGVRLKQFTGSGADSPDSAAVEFFSTWDGRPWADPNGPAFVGQLVQHWRLAPNVVLRLVLNNFAPAERLEWGIYAASPDGRMLAVTSWGCQAPEHGDLLMFNKQGIAAVAESRPHPASTRAGETSVARPAAALLNSPLLGVWIAADRGSASDNRGDGAAVHVIPTELRFRREGEGVREDQLGALEAITPLVSSWLVDPHLVVRRAIQSGRPLWTVFVISQDGARMVLTSWEEQTPEDQHSRAYSKQNAGL